MAWDDDKTTGDELTANEWDTHVSDQKNHSGRHEDGGADELVVDGLSGVLSDPQPPIEEDVDDFVNDLLAAGDWPERSSTRSIIGGLPYAKSEFVA